MKKIILSLATAAILLGGCAAKNAPAEQVHAIHTAHATHHWGYEGEVGPLHWGDLEEKYFMCKEGKNQSPVDITGARAVEKKHIGFSYYVGGDDVIYNGHAVQVNYRPGSSVTIDGHKFELKQYHFHTPSENTIDGKHFPMEAHFVHADKNGNLAVLALMFKEGAPNPELDKILEVLSRKKGEDKKMIHPGNASALMPMDVDYYRYNGSLTTPPCSEGVVWIVFKKPVTASPAQIMAIHNEIGHNNNRPVQPINARVILR
jgi:carbonic anhydrase